MPSIDKKQDEPEFPVDKNARGTLAADYLLGLMSEVEKETLGEYLVDADLNQFSWRLTEALLWGNWKKPILEHPSVCDD